MSIKGEFSLKRFSGLISINALCLFTIYQLGFLNYQTIGPIEKYGYFIPISIYTMKLIGLIGTLPYLVFIVATTLIKSKKAKNVPQMPQKPICFRVVTRGMFPQLVKTNRDYNLSVLKCFENFKYTYEVVTDKKIGDIDTIKNCYEVVIPEDYSTKTGAKYKARALQYAYEQNISNLHDDEFVVHLDEETRLTKGSISGIINFANENKHQIGQGAIAYGKGEIVHLLNTISDSMRVSHDLGPLHFSLKYLNKPTMDFKGSFLVCQHGVEKSITFDHGLEGSITEDTYFVVKAVNNGYTCDWIDGEMLEQSPFTFMDIIRQRRRWHQGAYYVAFSNNLKRDFCGTAYKYLFINSIIALFGTFSFFSSFFYTVSFHPADIFLEYMSNACQWYFYCFGITKNFNFNSKYSVLIQLPLFLIAPIIVRYLDICHMISLSWALSTSKSDFQIVKKSHEETTKCKKIEKCS